MNGKLCTSCNIHKTLSDFYPRHTRGPGATAAYCKVCEKSRKQTPEAKKQKRLWDLKRLYNLSPEDYNHLLNKQANCCAICTARAGALDLHVDHNHDTGAVRGLLCIKCNRGIGLLGDSPETLLRAISYLKGAA